jgi:hypothetical protein
MILVSLLVALFVAVLILLLLILVPIVMINWMIVASQFIERRKHY